MQVRIPMAARTEPRFHSTQRLTKPANVLLHFLWLFLLSEAVRLLGDKILEMQTGIKPGCRSPEFFQDALWLLAVLQGNSKCIPPVLWLLRSQRDVGDGTEKGVSRHWSFLSSSGERRGVI